MTKSTNGTSSTYAAPQLQRIGSLRDLTQTFRRPSRRPRWSWWKWWWAPTPAEPQVESCSGNGCINS